MAIENPLKPTTAQSQTANKAGITNSAPFFSVNMYHLFNNYGGKDMMYRTELLEEITIENATVKINAKIEEMEKESYRLVTMSFWGTERAVLVFKKGLKGSLL